MDAPLHFVGIGGAGMSGLAELYARRGLEVTGCDAALGLETAADLARQGIRAISGHNAAHVTGVRTMVVTSAMPPDHPELAAARAAGIPIVRRAEALGHAVNTATVVGIAGTHGKTTTTVMATEALLTAGLHPTGVAGGRVARWGGNLRYAGETLFVVEADEYDRSFLALRPTIAVVTNVEADHLDVYADLGEIRETFERFLAPARGVVLCADDAGSASLRCPGGAEVVRYGVESHDARVVARDVTRDGGRTRFRVTFDGTDIGEVELRVPGMHNVRNALAAIAAGLALGQGVSLEGMQAGLEDFEGVERRFQRLGRVNGVDVVDDYAHHPTEITATLDAARMAYPGRRIVVAFQPHLYSRTRDFSREFGDALSAADVVFLAEIYPAREAPLPGVTSALITNALRVVGRPPAWEGPRSTLGSALAAVAREGDVVLTLGAGDITRTGPELIHLLTVRGST